MHVQVLHDQLGLGVDPKELGLQDGQLNVGMGAVARQVEGRLARDLMNDLWIIMGISP